MESNGVWSRDEHVTMRALSEALRVTPFALRRLGVKFSSAVDRATVAQLRRHRSRLHEGAAGYG